MISINMTIIGLTSLAEKKTIIGVDYGKYLINKYKLFHIVPLYLMLILFAVVNTAALFTLYWTDSQFCLSIFIGLTVCLSFAIYYFFGFILRENNSVKRHNKEIPQTYRPRALWLYRSRWPCKYLMGVFPALQMVGTSRKVDPRNTCNF